MTNELTNLTLQFIFLVDSLCATADACAPGMTCAIVPAGHVCLCADGAEDCTYQEGNVDGRRKGGVGDRGTHARERERERERKREREREREKQ